ncbi:unnamed protein product [Phytophthora fragariaefolia]|uniref:Unnamed protein product n=1 Tax=Phytophthora fragariaefolia TaxID=1490495 RepID=A0A9W6U178_9STRA|nr:unnamed protein product [Phytophthora fragariaefolia]
MLASWHHGGLDGGTEFEHNEPLHRLLGLSTTVFIIAMGSNAESVSPTSVQQKTSLLSPNAVKQFNYAVLKLQSLLFHTVIVGIGLRYAAFTAAASLGRIFALISAVLHIPGMVVFVAGMRAEYVKIILPTFDFCFVQAANTLWAITFSAIMKDARVALVVVCWASFTNSLFQETYLRNSTFMIIFTLVEWLFNALLMVWLVVGLVDEVQHYTIVTSRGRTISTKDVLENTMGTMAMVTLRYLYRRYRYARRQKKRRDTAMQALGYRCKIALGAVDRLMSASSDVVPHVDTQPKLIRASSSRVDTHYLTLKTGRYPQLLMYLATDGTKFDAQNTVWPNNNLVNSVAAWKIWILYSCGAASNSFAVLSLFLPEHVYISEAIAVSGLMMSAAFSGTYFCCCERELLKRVMTSFHFVFFAIQILLAGVCVMDMFYWRWIPACGVFSNLMLSYTILTIDALTLVMKRRICFKFWMPVAGLPLDSSRAVHMVQFRRLGQRQQNSAMPSERQILPKNSTQAFGFVLLESSHSAYTQWGSNVADTQSQNHLDISTSSTFRSLPLLQPKSRLPSGKISPPRLVILGPPAGGKGTQCELLVELLGVVHMSTGNILRQAIQNQTPLGLKAQQFMDHGELVPDELIVDVVLGRLAESDCVTRGWLLDGFPRTARQAEALLTAQGGMAVPDCVLDLEVPDNEVIRRIASRRVDPESGKTYNVEFNPPPADVAHRVVQRSDDTEEKIKTRLVQFHAHADAVRSVFEAYRGKFGSTIQVMRVSGFQAPPAIAQKFADFALEHAAQRSLGLGAHQDEGQPASARTRTKVSTRRFARQEPHLTDQQAEAMPSSSLDLRHRSLSEGCRLSYMAQEDSDVVQRSPEQDDQLLLMRRGGESLVALEQRSKSESFICTAQGIVIHDTKCQSYQSKLASLVALAASSSSSQSNVLLAKKALRRCVAGGREANDVHDQVATLDVAAGEAATELKFGGPATSGSLSCRLVLRSPISDPAGSAPSRDVAICESGVVLSVSLPFAASAKMEEWVHAKVALLGLDASAYVEYALGLLQDEDMDVSERVASVAAVFAGAADGLVEPAELQAALDEQEMARDVTRLLQAAQQQSQQQQELELAQKQLRDLQLRERQRQEAEHAAQREKQQAAERLKNMTREQIAAREQLISEYGFTVMSEFDEEGNVVKIKDKDRSAAAADAGPANSNRLRVQQAQSAMRDKMKKEHEKKIKYEKELLAKDKARKDKTKKRTMKREKQRGCG